MTDADIEAIVGGYHSDAFRILGPHGVRKKTGQARWEVRAFLPQADSGRSGSRRPTLPHGQTPPARLLLRQRSKARRGPTGCAPVCGTAARWNSKTPTASARNSPIPTFTCTARARCSRPTAPWARTSSNRAACAVSASPSGRPMPSASRWPASSTSGISAAIPCAAAMPSGRSLSPAWTPAPSTNTTCARALPPTSSSRPIPTHSCVKRRPNRRPWCGTSTNTSGATPRGWKRAPRPIGSNRRFPSTRCTPNPGCAARWASRSRTARWRSNWWSTSS